MVPGRGIAPPRLSALPPQGSLATVTTPGHLFALILLKIPQ